MAINSTTNLGLALPTQGEWDGTWGTNTNEQITTLIDSAVAGTTTLSTNADVTLTDTNFVANQSRQAILRWTASNGATTRNVTAPARSKGYLVVNDGTGSIVLRGAGPTTGITIVAGERCVAAWAGSDFVKVSNSSGAGAFTNVTVSGTATLSGLTASTALALNSSKGVVSVTNTGSGNNVLATSPTLVTPALGTPTALVGTNITGTATNFNINGTVGATTPSTGAFTTLSASGNVTLSGGTANGVAYLNGSKVLTTGTALQFDGSRLGFGVTPNNWATAYGVIDADGLYIGSRTFTVNLSNVYLSPTGYQAVGTGYCSNLELSSGTGALIFRTDPTSRTAGQTPNMQNAFVVNKNGLVSAIGIYTNTVTSARSVSVNSSGDLGYVSSIRASKTNIEAIDDVQWLMALDPVKFNYRKRDEEQNYTAEFDEEVEYGLIAEDAEQVNADIVFHDIVEGQKELRGVHYNKLVAPLLKLAQQQQATITALTARVEALEAAARV